MDNARSMRAMTTMAWKGRLTKQGLRDLNYYGPRRTKETAAAPPPAAPVAAAEAGPEAQPQAPPDAEAQEGGALVK